MSTSFSKFDGDVENLPSWMKLIKERYPTMEEQCSFIDEYYNLDNISDEIMAMIPHLESQHDIQLFIAVENFGGIEFEDEGGAGCVIRGGF